jgi:hypothetical protein
MPSSNQPQKPIRGLGIRSRLAKRRSRVFYLLNFRHRDYFSSSNLMQKPIRGLSYCTRLAKSKKDEKGKVTLNFLNPRP